MNPVTVETIADNKRLTHNPITKEAWTTGFEKEFINMVQGDNFTNTVDLDATSSGIIIRFKIHQLLDH